MRDWAESGVAIPFVYQRRVRWGDGDPALIAYTVRFLDYAMEAIEEWFRAVLGIDWYQLAVRQGMGAPVVHLEFDFTAPLRPGDEVAIEIRVAELRRSTISFLFNGLREGTTPSFSGKIVECFIDSTGDRLKAAPIPASYRRRIEAYIAACAAADTQRG
ncbi:MAG: acyl-CoA thioesterase [Gammaproteobacteria bacterium]